MTHFYFPTFIYVKILHLQTLLNLMLPENLHVHQRNEKNDHSVYRGVFSDCYKTASLCTQLCFPGCTLPWPRLLLRESGLLEGGGALTAEV